MNIRKSRRRYEGTSQPYATLIASGEKWIENRKWATDYRGLLAIHAGKGTQYVSAAHLPQFKTGGIIAIAKLVACFHRTTIKRNATLAFAERLAVGCKRTWIELNAHRHAEGPYCWILEDVVETRLLACRGMQGLWDVPTHHRCTIERLGLE